MAQEKVFVFYRLRDDVSMDDYIAWSQAVDQKITPELEAIKRFEVYRVTEMIEGGDRGSVDVIEAIDVENIEAWKKGNVSEHMKQIQAEWPKYAATETAIVCGAVPIPADGK